MEKVNGQDIYFREWLEEMYVYKEPSRYVGVAEKDGIHWYKWSKRKKRYEEKRQIPPEDISGKAV